MKKVIVEDSVSDEEAFDDNAEESEVEMDEEHVGDDVSDDNAESEDSDDQIKKRERNDLGDYTDLE